MKFEKVLTLNLGNYQSLKIGISECSSFDECDIMLSNELARMGISLDSNIAKLVNKIT